MLEHTSKQIDSIMGNLKNSIDWTSLVGPIYSGERLVVYELTTIADEFFTEFYLSKGPIYICILDSKQTYWFHLESRLFKTLDGAWVSIVRLVSECDEFYAAFEKKAERALIPELVRVHSEKFCLKVIDAHPICFTQLKFQSRKTCLAAVKRNGLLIADVKDQTPDICMEAVMQNGLAIQFIRNQTEELRLTAVLSTPRSIQYMQDPSEAVQIEAVKKEVSVLEFIKAPSEKVCLTAINNSPIALMWIKAACQTEKMCLEAVKIKGDILCLCSYRTPEICLEAVKQNGLAINYVPEETRELVEEAVKQNKYAFYYVKDRSLVPTEFIPEEYRGFYEK